MRNKLSGDNHATWDFWMRWWDGVLSGNQLDWELQKEVAQIPDSTWQQGPAVVAHAISVIEENWRLRKELANLQAQSLAALAALDLPPPRGHNHPPELIEADDEGLKDEVGKVARAAEAAHAELAKPAPEPAALREYGAILKASALAIARYCGVKFDVFVTEAVKELAKAAGFSIKAVLLTAILSGTLGPALTSFANRIAAGNAAGAVTPAGSSTATSPAAQQP